jgi:hypothetical protein
MENIFQHFHNITRQSKYKSKVILSRTGQFCSCVCYIVQSSNMQLVDITALAVNSNVSCLWVMIVQNKTAEVLDTGHVMQWTGCIL